MTTKDKEFYAMLIAVLVTIICSIFIGSICTFIATKDTKTNSDEETATWDKTGKVPDDWAVTSSEDDDDFLSLIAIGNIFIRSEAHE